MRSIGEVAAAYNVTLRALRFWEEKGLITPERVYFARMYSDEQHERVGKIVTWSAVGFSIKEMDHMLSTGEVLEARLMVLEAEARQRIEVIERLKWEWADGRR